MQERSVNFLISLAERNPQQTVLIVAHAGVIRGLVSHFLGLNYAEHLKHKISHRYIGDFLLEGDTCVRYDELGKPSGFVCDGVIQVPFDRQASADPATTPDVGSAPVFPNRPVPGNDAP
jgi:hypothetical protein